MVVEVTIIDAAERDIAALPGRIQMQVFEVVQRLAKWPNVSGAKALKGEWRGFSRVRSGDYRVIFEIHANRIRIVRVAHRREVYD